MNQNGFFTIVGLCLLIVATIFIKGILEFEANYSRVVTNFESEYKLQILADSYLFENINVVDGNEEFKLTYNLGDFDGLKNVTVEVHARRGDIDINNGDSTNFPEFPHQAQGIIILSIASCDSLVIGKMFRRAFAYIDDDTKTIHFMN